jgi:hypothetical protein
MKVVNYYFKDTVDKQLSELSLSSPEIATDKSALWVGLARNAKKYFSNYFTIFKSSNIIHMSRRSFSNCRYTGIFSL